MLMQGQYLRVMALGDGLYELVFDNQHQPINTVGQACISELGDAIALLQDRDDLRGLMISSDHEGFIVGSDLQAFPPYFSQPDDHLVSLLSGMNDWFNRLEALSVPTVAAINGDALGSGYELCLACDFRVISETAGVALPEVGLGLIPGLGGTVRLPRLIGLDNAIDWICSGRRLSAREVMEQGAVDACVSPQRLREAALDLLVRAAAGEFDYRYKRALKRNPLPLTELALTLAIETARSRMERKRLKHYPAPLAALDLLREQASLEADAASELETRTLIKLMRSNAAPALVNLVINEQRTRQIAHACLKQVGRPNVGVLGAGVMGRAIACQAALKKLPVVLKDIKSAVLERAMTDLSQDLGRRAGRGQIAGEERIEALGRIRPTLSYGEFIDTDFAVEAVIEVPGVKAQALAEWEAALPATAILASNTSGIPLSALSRGLKRPQQFCGIHFFNPVSKIALVEVVRGAKTSDETINRALGFVQAMGKTPVVVRDCPGFFVNRVGFAYLIAFLLLLRDGVDYARIDRVMEAYGWRIGPARLIDGNGLNTVRNACGMLAAGYPDRMTFPGESVLDRLCALKRTGLKSGAGFYRYDPQGQRNPVPDLKLAAEIESLTERRLELDDQGIIDRMMLPLMIEATRALEEGVVGSPAEADVALVLGLGYPAFRGGVFYALDRYGLGRFVAKCQRYAELGPLYRPGLQLRELASRGRGYENL